MFHSAASLCITAALSMLVLDSNKNRKSKYWLCLLRCMVALRQERLSSTARESHPSASLPSVVSSRGSCLFLSSRFEERLPPEAPVGKSVTARPHAERGCRSLGGGGGGWRRGWGGLNPLTERPGGGRGAA